MGTRYFGGYFLWLVLVFLLILGKQKRAQEMGEKAITQRTQPVSLWIFHCFNKKHSICFHCTCPCSHRKAQNGLLTKFSGWTILHTALHKTFSGHSEEKLRYKCCARVLRSQQCPSCASSTYRDVLHFHVVLMHFTHSLKNNRSIFPRQSTLLSILHVPAVHPCCLDRQERDQSRAVTSTPVPVTHVSWHFWPHTSVTLNLSTKSTKWVTRNATSYLQPAPDCHWQTSLLSTSPVRFPPSLSLTLMLLFHIINNVSLIIFQINLSSLPTPTRWLTEAKFLGPVLNPARCWVYVIFTDVNGPSGSFRYYLNKPQVKTGSERTRMFLLRFLNHNNGHEPSGHIAEAPSVSGMTPIVINSKCGSSITGKVWKSEEHSHGVSAKSM